MPADDIEERLAAPNPHLPKEPNTMKLTPIFIIAALCCSCATPTETEVHTREETPPLSTLHNVVAPTKADALKLLRAHIPTSWVAPHVAYLAPTPSGRFVVVKVVTGDHSTGLLGDRGDHLWCFSFLEADGSEACRAYVNAEKGTVEYSAPKYLKCGGTGQPP